jgi:hypothetical protein
MRGLRPLRKALSRGSHRQFNPVVPMADIPSEISATALWEVDSDRFRRC